MSSGEPHQDPDGDGIKCGTVNSYTDESRGDYSCHLTLFDLPWDDVIFVYILPKLSIPTLFHLRQVCTQFHQLIREYFSVMKDLNLARIAGRMNLGAFQTLTCDNTNLVSLNLRNSKDWLKDDTLVTVLKSNPKLLSLDLTYCNSLTNVCMQVLAMNCLRLKSLVLRDCPWLATEGLTVVVLNCNKLETIDVTGCWNVTNDAIIVMAQSCSKLKSVSLSNLYGLSDNALTMLARQCQHLHHLNIQGCWRITDDSVRFLGEYSKNLKMLQIRECRHVTEKTLSKLRENGVRMDKRPPPSSNNQRMDLLNRRLRHRLNVQI